MSSEVEAPERVLRVHEVAEHLGCDDSVIYRMIQGGDMRAIHVGRLLRVPESAVAEFIQRGGTRHGR